MKHIEEIYTKEIYDNLKPLHANWLPGKPVSLGDFGIMEGRLFIHVGNIKELGISYEPRFDDTGDSISFASQGSAEIKFTAKGAGMVGDVPNANASLEINFSRENSLFFNAADCKYEMIKNKAALAAEIMKRYKQKNWERKWAVVTDLVHSKATTIAVSSSKSSSIILGASTNIKTIDLTDASLKLSIRKMKDISYKEVTTEGLIPLLGLSKIQPTFLWFGKKFKPASLLESDYRTVEAMRDLPEFQTEETPEDLSFSQTW